MGSMYQVKNLVGNDPCAFWRDIAFLDIQGEGASQKEMLALFSTVLEEHCGFAVTDCGTDPQAYVYLDDAIFTGNRVRRDLESWITDAAPPEARVHIITIALHSSGQYYALGNISKAATRVGKKSNLVGCGRWN